MAKAVFTTKIDPTYDDLPEVRYHFPKTYLNQATAAVNDWIVYYEPRRSSGKLSSRGGRQCYFAIARVDRVEPDPNLANHYYAYAANPWGLQQLRGNVWEWCADLWYANYDKAPRDGSVGIKSADNVRYVLRGGAWDFFPLNLRAANRGKNHRIGRSSSFGFRLARTLTP